MAPRPSAAEIRVATDDLRAEAKIWSAASADFSKITNELSALKFDRIQAGLFQVIVKAHDDLVEWAHDRCKEGSIAFDNLSTTLHRVADVYDDEDAKFADQLRDVY